MENRKNYNFTLVPTKLMMLLDNKLKSLLFVLINQYGAFKKENEDYTIIYSYISVFSDLTINEIKSGLDIFQRMSIISITQASDKGCSLLIDFDKITEFDTLSYKDCLNKDNKIRLTIVEEYQMAEAKVSTRDSLLNAIKGLNV